MHFPLETAWCKGIRKNMEWVPISGIICTKVPWMPSAGPNLQIVNRLWGLMTILKLRGATAAATAAANTYEECNVSHVLHKLCSCR